VSEMQLNHRGNRVAASLGELVSPAGNSLKKSGE
jgi:hypothetical protein